MSVNKKINGGAFLVARKIFLSPLWLKKPSSWKIIWIYILGKVNHKDTEGLKRGEGYFNFVVERKNIGNDITYNNIREFTRFARKWSMIDTTRTTRGVVVKVLQYEKFQTLYNYQNTTRNKIKTQAKQNKNTPIYKNGKNEKNEKNTHAIFEIFWKDYPRKINKQKALDAFGNVDCDLSIILVALQKQKKSKQWTEQDGRYIPGPVKWLKEEQWKKEKIDTQETSEDLYAKYNKI